MLSLRTEIKHACSLKFIPSMYRKKSPLFYLCVRCFMYCTQRTTGKVNEGLPVDSTQMMLRTQYASRLVML